MSLKGFEKSVGISYHKHGNNSFIYTEYIHFLILFCTCQGGKQEDENIIGGR